MSLRSAVVVVVDRWGAGFLGPYGNTWLDTPALNHFATRALLAETVLADSPRLEGVYRSYWTGRHVAEPAADSSLPAALRQRDLASALVTDEPRVADHPLAAAFGQIVRVPASAPQQPADDPAETAMRRLFAAAVETLAAQSEPFLLWIHSRGMEGPWDAPLAYREQFRDEEDPLPGDFVAPPQMRIEKGFDPDELLKLVHAYAGQVSLLDQQVGALVAAIDERRDRELLVALTSPRGYPLGEHGRVGTCDEALYGELLQVPLLVRFPGNQGALARTQQILQPADLGAAVAEHFGVHLGATGGLHASAPTAGDKADTGRQAAGGTLGQIARNEDHPPREIAFAIGDKQRAIRTPAWFLRESIVDQQRHYELFAKPDDRWEVNEISSRCGQELELLIAALDEFEQAALGGTLARLTPLPEILRGTWR